MKCPKCSYLGFETGDRCKNCGYDFSLLSAADDQPADLQLRDREPMAPTPTDWLDQLDRGLSTPPSPLPEPHANPLAPMPLDTIVTAPSAVSAAAVPAAAMATAPAAATAAAPRTDVARPVMRRVPPSLPLFHPGAGDDEPLIKMPAQPRPPLAVRRTPDKARLRAVPKPAPRLETAEAAPEAVEPVLEFAPEPEVVRPPRRAASAPAETSGPAPRLAAALLDHLILTGIDLTVVYFTLKMAGLTLDEWRVVPIVPLVAFLMMVKAAYFCAFTLVGGQTIGKMALHLRVVSDDDSVLDPPRAMQRTVTGLLSLLTFGLAYLPVLLADDHRAIHDRVARTRVVTQP